MFVGYCFLPKSCCNKPLRNSGTSKRSSTRPCGEESYESVRNGNILAVRTLIILMIAQSLGCFWLLEQPKGSMMELHPRFQEFMNMIPTWKHSIIMKDYGAPSQKPTWLYARPMHLLILERRRAVSGFNDNNPTPKKNIHYPTG